MPLHGGLPTDDLPHDLIVSCRDALQQAPATVLSILGRCPGIRLRSGEHLSRLKIQARVDLLEAHAGLVVA